MKAQEIFDIADKLNEILTDEEDKHSFCHGDFGKELDNGNNFIEGVGEYKHITQEGGEGEGDTYFGINYFPEQDVYIRIDGTWVSHDGLNFYYGNCCKEVKPVDKVVTFYE